MSMRWWWLFGLLLVYTACINLGGELLLLMSYRGLGAITVALWGNGAIFVSLAECLSAAWRSAQRAHLDRVPC